MRVFIVSVLIVGVGTLAPSAGFAQRASTEQAPVATAEAPTIGPDADTLTAAIGQAAASGTAEGAQSISRLLTQGVPPRVAAAGLDALGVLARPEGGATVQRFLSHRRATLRRHAIAAAREIIAAQPTNAAALVAGLVGRLSDPDERVRGEAATALGDVGTARETSVAFLVFEREIEQPHGPQGSPVAHDLARWIGRAGTVEQVQLLLGFLRRAPLATMSDALGLAARRRDVPEALKLRIVSEVGNLATQGVRAFLSSIADAPRDCGPAVSRAARAALDRLPEGS